MKRKIGDRTPRNESHPSALSILRRLLVLLLQFAVALISVQRHHAICAYAYILRLFKTLYSIPRAFFVVFNPTKIARVYPESCESVIPYGLEYVVYLQRISQMFLQRVQEMHQNIFLRSPAIFIMAVFLMENYLPFPCQYLIVSLALITSW